MKTVAQIKRALIAQRTAVTGDRQAISFCTNCAMREARRIVTHPLALAASFGAGWFTANLAHRPKQVKQVRNVTIKRPGLTSQLIKMVAPYVISELRTEQIVKDTQQQTNLEN